MWTDMQYLLKEFFKHLLDLCATIDHFLIHSLLNIHIT